MTQLSPSPKTDHVLIVGASKTGTTGLYASIKNGMARAGVDAITIFEPSHAHVLDSLFLFADRPILTKTTTDHVAITVPEPLVFDRRVMTVRDPRDMLISSLLFRPLTRRALEKANDAAIEAFLSALERKEQDPRSVSVRELFDLAEQQGIGSVPYKRSRAMLIKQEKLQHDADFLAVQYERFVDNELGELSEYLGYDVENVSDSSSAMFGHIARSGTYGEFRNWFTPEDLQFYNEMYGESIIAFGYDKDAELAANPVIDPATSSHYIRSRYQSRREQLHQAASRRRVAWTPTSVTSVDEFDHLVSYAEDGDATACLRVAEVSWSGHLGGRDVPAALKWARRSAELGLPAGMRFAARILREAADEVPPSEAPALRRDALGWQAIAATRAQRRSAAADDGAPSDRLPASTVQEQVKQLQRELDRVRRSARMRAGQQLVALAQHPLRSGPTALRELRSLWREANASARR